MSPALIELSSALADLTARTASTVVAVHTDSRGSSSGVIWRPGVIVTAEHTLRRDEEIQVTLPDGRAVLASLVGRDSSTDLAVLKSPEANTALPDLGEATTLRPGSLIMVVGRTRVSGPIAALGIVSLVAAERRTWTGASLAPYIRLDVNLQHTAIGGAATSADGKTFGIVTPRFGRFGSKGSTCTMTSRTCGNSACSFAFTSWASRWPSCTEISISFFFRPGNSTFT